MEIGVCLVASSLTTSSCCLARFLAGGRAPRECSLRKLSQGCWFCIRSFLKLGFVILDISKGAVLGFLSFSLLCSPGCLQLLCLLLRSFLLLLLGTFCYK